MKTKVIGARYSTSFVELLKRIQRHEKLTIKEIIIKSVINYYHKYT